MSVGSQEGLQQIIQFVRQLSTHVEASQLTPAGLSLPVPAQRAHS
jgi:hypothetical protein